MDGFLSYRAMFGAYLLYVRGGVVVDASPPAPWAMGQDYARLRARAEAHGVLLEWFGSDEMDAAIAAGLAR